MSLKIAILGTRGIPNHYGGFEQITEDLAMGLYRKGHAVSVYNSHKHPYRQKEWNGVEIIHCFDPEYLIGTAGQFIYDLNCILHARKRKFDIILLLGYTSSSVWRRLYPKKSLIISNMDGLEWKRTKYSKKVQQFLKYAEKLAVAGSHYHIADSLEIKKYLDETYHISCKYIAYGAALYDHDDENALADYQLKEQEYFLLMARMEPENNIEMILDGFHQTASAKKFMVIGNTDNHYGKMLLQKFAGDNRIVFTGPIFDRKKVYTITRNASLYFHGHSVGGTNPSLLEAMAAKALIAAHHNEFNKAILEKNAFYFCGAAEVRALIEMDNDLAERKDWVTNNFKAIENKYTWKQIVNEYESFFMECCSSKK